MSMQFERIFIEFPSLRTSVYGDAQLPPAESEEGQRVRAVMDLALLNADLIRSQKRFIPRDARLYWAEYARLIVESPSARAYIEENPDLFSTELTSDL